MKFTPGRVFILIVAAIAAFVLIAVLRDPSRRASQDEDFLETLHELQERATDAITTGNLPPIDTDPSVVPKIVFETDELDLGEVPNDAFFHGKLRVRNEGQRPLRINSVKTSCACTTGSIDPDRSSIAPGGEGYIDIQIDPYRIPGFTSRKVLTINSNDPQRPSAEVHVSVQVRPEFEVVPAELDFGEVSKGSSAESTVLVRQIEEGEFEVKSISLYSPGEQGFVLDDLELSMEERPADTWAVPGKREYQVHIAVGPQVPPGNLLRQVMLETTTKRLPYYFYEVSATVTAPYRIEPTFPAALAVAPAALGATASGRATITSDEALSVRDLQYNTEVLEVRIAPADSPGVVFLDVSVLPGVPPGRLDDLVSCTIQVGDRAFEERIAVRGYVAKALESTPSAASAASSNDLSR